MSPSLESLRTFVIERLTVAAEEIFLVFQEKIDEYEARTAHQRRVVESVWRPRVKLHRIEFSRPPLRQEKMISTRQNQDSSCSVEQESAEPPPVKEEHGEPCCHRDREQLTVKQEGNAFMVTPIHEDDDQNEDPVLDLSPGQSDDKSKVKTTVETCASRDTSANPIPASAVDCNTNTGTTSATCHTVKEVNVTTYFTGNSPVHASDKPDALSACEKGSRRSSFLSVHTKNRKAVGPFICGICGKEFKQSVLLKRHVRIHSDERPYACATCGRAFRQNFQLIRHTKCHTGVRLFVCKTCGETFKQNSLLKDHMKGHIGERPYICTTCKKPFRYYSNLERHVNYHAGETPCLCKTCGKTFRRNSDLRVHRRVHTGERPYLCKTCGKGFKQVSALNAHAILHTGQRPYVCKICGKAFKQNSTLSAHVKLHFRGEVIRVQNMRGSL